MKIRIILITLAVVGFFTLILMDSPFSRATLYLSDRTLNMSSMRSIQTALLGYYAANEGRYPDNLQKLISEKHDEEYSFLESKDLELIDIDLHYISGLSVHTPEKIILYTSAEEEGKALVGLVNGQVYALEPEELNKLLIKQGISPIKLPAKDE